MNTTYLFLIDGHRVIINEEYSSIGYCYPRLFVEVSPEEHLNFDLTIGACFGQTLAQFESWLDGTEIADADLHKVCNRLHLNYDALINLVCAK